MKKLSLVMIILWCFIGVLILGMLVAGLIFNTGVGSIFNFQASGKSGSTLYIDKSIPADSVRNVKLDLASDMCKFYLTDEGDINVKHYGQNIPEQRRANIVQTGDTVTISTKGPYNHGFWFFAWNSYSLVEIYLPKSYHDALDIGISSGTLDFNGPFELNEIDVAVSSGTVRADNEIKTKTANINVLSGTIRLTGGLAAENYDIKVSSGTINVDKRLSGSGNIKATSGTIKLYGVDIAQSLKVGASSGTISIELAEAQNLKFYGKKSSGTIKTYFETYSKGDRNYYATVGEGPYKELAVQVTSGTVRVTSADGGNVGNTDSFESDFDFDFDFDL